MYTDKELIEKDIARIILSIIEKIYFSEEYFQYRIDRGSNGTRDLILKTIEEEFNLWEVND